MKDITKQKSEDLQKELVTKRKEGHDFRFNLSGAKVKNVRTGRTARRTIARILTELHARKQ